ncbi:glycosyltransferase family 2 protein [Candidatus Chazhemtobacterium aquaticus]|uniref:Glycosyl transferase family 2 n=1 Tax=Candidatus Chazhemtobacterium aquaticus TaxID=2715735 RepID=A0A857NH84_9BACT|nr:glycosyltransferase family 2 protein [Candidatus Chazhemtobacterium aquaticus]QHO63488.1 Glycosyl transferase family 2 [Candidatus Chazhemtobacterium aquaticus]
MPKSATLSIALATYNEQDNIVDCLKSLKGIATEVIVVDGSSTDQTRQLAKKHKAKVYKTTNKPIFHINKNLAIKKCKGDWILQLDADERLTPELKEEIAQVLSGSYFGYTDWRSSQKYQADTPPVAYWLKRRNYFLGHYFTKSGQYPDPVIRLFRRGFATLPAKSVHEQMKVNGPLAWLKSDLDHFATPTFSRYIQRENRYSSLTAQELKDGGVTINPFSFINFIFIKPLSTFLAIYLRHKGFQDGFSGFVFALFSGLHHALSYIKLWELKSGKRNLNLQTDWS